MSVHRLRATRVRAAAYPDLSAKFTFDEEGHPGQASGSVMSGGCILSGALLAAFFVGVFRCFVSFYGVIESTLAVFHSLGSITFNMVLGSGAMCLGRIVMMLGGFKVCIDWHIHSPCPEFPFWIPGSC